MTERKLKVGDKVRLTGSEWCGGDLLPPRGEIVTITYSRGGSIARFKYEDTEFNTATSAYYDKNWFDRWGCEFADEAPEQPLNQEYLFETQLGARVQVWEHMHAGDKTSVRVVDADGKRASWLDMTDQELDDFITMLQFVQMQNQNKF